MENCIFDSHKIQDKETYIAYCNAKGEVNKFHLVNISISPQHFQGISLPERQFKTFRKDRVLGIYNTYSELGDINLSIFKTKILSISPVKISKTNSISKIEVCFTGFSKSDKTRLIDIATEHDMLIRSDVTKKLTYLCCGYNAGAKKHAKARENGALALTEKQFLSLVETGEIPELGEYDLLSLKDKIQQDKKEENILDIFSTIRTLPRRQALIANFVNNYAVGWRFKVHQCHRASLDIKLTDMTFNGKTKQVWTQGQAFNFIGGEVIESSHSADEPNIALQIKFSTPAGFDTVDTIDGEFTGTFRKNNAATKKGELKVNSLPIEFHSQTYDEGNLTVDVYFFEGDSFTLKERITLTQVEFVTLLQFGKVMMITENENKKQLEMYDPFSSNEELTVMKQ